MTLGNEQTMAWKQRPVIQKREGELILENFVRGRVALDNFAKQAAFLEFRWRWHFVRSALSANQRVES